MLFIRANQLSELEHHNLEDYSLRKRAKYLITKCKDAMWLRWTKEYIRGLRARHCVNKAGNS